MSTKSTISPNVIQFFEAYFSINQRPTRTYCKALKILTGISFGDIQTWFKSRRIEESIRDVVGESIGSREQIDHTNSQVNSSNKAGDHDPTVNNDISNVPMEELANRQDTIFNEFARYYQAIMQKKQASG